MPTAEICSHVWNYSRLASLHLSAIVLDPPKNTQVTCTICYCTEDADTVAVLEYFGKIEARNVTWNWRPMERIRLMRRAIGRDEVCRSTKADVLLLSDVDYLLSGSVIDEAVAEMLSHDSPRLFYPRIVLESIDHARGDSEILAVRRPGIYGITPERYHESRLPRAIGGAQWIFRETANSKGYLPQDHRFMRPEEKWKRTMEDQSARGYWGLDQVALNVRGVRRVRHSQRGRFDIGVRL